MSVAVDFTADSDSDSDKDLQEEGIDIVTPRIASSITNTNTNSSKRGTGDLGKLLPNTDGKSKVWNHYKRYENDRNQCVCNHCGKQITISKCSTTGLKSHIRTKHSELYRTEIQEDADTCCFYLCTTMDVHETLNVPIHPVVPIPRIQIDPTCGVRHPQTAR